MGRGCTSAAWCASVIASAGRLVAALPAPGPEDVWEKGASTVISAGLAPTGTARPVRGGWRVSGGWAYVSAVDFADWALLAARVPEHRGGAAHVRVCAVPRSDYRVEDTWRTIGLRGTGSHTVTLDSVLVPEYRSLPLDVLLAGSAPGESSACHRIPLKAANGLTLAAPLLGSARAALSRWWQIVGSKVTASREGVTPPAEAAPFEHQYARAEGEIDAALLLLESVARRVDEAHWSAHTIARNGRDCALAADLLAGTVGKLVRTAGTRAQDESEELQRRWRDVTCGAGHSGLQFPPAATAYVRFMTGWEPPRTP
ncbi:actinorhodin polyketide dimerase ActVA [Streptomyces chumphonensis]